MKTTPRRTGFTLLEVLVTMALLIILGALIAPSMRAMSGNSKSKAGADVVKARLSEARAAAIGQGRAYRVTLSPDGSQVQVSPEDPQQPTTSGNAATPVYVTEQMPTGVKATPMATPEEPQPTADSDGWLRIVTYLPDGTCREEDAAVEVREGNTKAIVVRIRGLTGATSIDTAAGGGPHS
jgi:prepilin-type N-terminal cleavage/methylation domain-containing protein